MDHPRSTLEDVAVFLKEEYKLEVSVKTIERELEEYDLSDLYKLVREKEKKTVHVNYAGGWLLAPFIADMVKKTEQAFGELAGSVEAILTLFFLSVTGLRPVDPACKGLSGNLFCPQDKWLQQLMQLCTSFASTSIETRTEEYI